MPKKFSIRKQLVLVNPLAEQFSLSRNYIIETYIFALSEVPENRIPYNSFVKEIMKVLQSTNVIVTIMNIP